MFLNRQYRARAIGILAAYALVAAGILIGVLLDSRRDPAATKAATPAERPEMQRVDNSSAEGKPRCDVVC
jgi:hypothetical protein